MSIKKIIAGLLATTLITICHADPFTLMLDPAGDAKHAGRVIDNALYERGITLQMAERIKRELEYNHPWLRVILTRLPGESIEPLQNAHFANRLNADLYISIHCYQEQNIKPNLSCYYFMGHPTDSWKKESSALTLKPYDTAHISSLPQTKEYGALLKKSLEQELYKKLFDVKALLGIPFKPLIGITCPSLGIEMSLKTKEQWILYITPLVNTLHTLINHIQRTHE